MTVQELSIKLSRINRIKNNLIHRKTMRKLSSLLFLTVSIVAATAAKPVLADWRDHGDIHFFHDHDFDHWRAGNWYHGIHEGRDGWWWIVDGAWYFYPAPVYPYPDPYVPPSVAVVPAPASPTVIAQPSYVYYCSNPAGYYPYVAQCYSPWRRVLASSAQAPTTVIVQQPAPTATVVQSAPPAPGVPAPIPAGGERDADVQQLNALTAEFHDIDLTGHQASTKLKSLGKQIEAFRESLYTRSYNAMSMLKDAETLEHQVTEARANLHKHHAAVTAPSTPAAPVVPPAAAPAPVPAPGSPPPGTTVTFPPQ